MKQLNRLLVVIDANEEWDANKPPIELSKALALVSDKASCTLKLLQVVYEKYLSHDNLSINYDQSEHRDQFIRDSDAHLQQLADSLRTQGFQLEAETQWAHPRYRATIAAAGDFQADLIVQHCRSYGRVTLGHLTNDSWQLVHHCETPLLLVRDSPWHQPPVLLAAVDPMHSHAKPIALDYQVLDSAELLQKSIGAEVHVVHAFAEAARPFAVAGSIKQAHQEEFAELMSFYSFPTERQHLLDESPVTALYTTREEFGADCIILGAVSRSRLSDMLIGNTTEQVLDYIPSDVLLLRPVPQ
jgi:universal stress protein E